MRVCKDRSHALEGSEVAARVCLLRLFFKRFEWCKVRLSTFPSRLPIKSAGSSKSRNPAGKWKGEQILCCHERCGKALGDRPSYWISYQVGLGLEAEALQRKKNENRSAPMAKLEQKSSGVDSCALSARFGRRDVRFLDDSRFQFPQI